MEKNIEDIKKSGKLPDSALGNIKAGVSNPEEIAKNKAFLENLKSALSHQKNKGPSNDVELTDKELEGVKAGINIKG